VSDLAAVTGLGWDTVKNIIKGRLEKDCGHPRWKELQRFSIDEIYVVRGKKFYPLVIDLNTSRIAWAAPGRGGEALRKFWRALRLSTAQIKALILEPTSNGISDLKILARLVGLYPIANENPRP
jgi:hypothetical protein